VRVIQYYLNVIAYFNQNLNNFAIDGVYGEDTANAVRVFQDFYSLAPTGTVDRPTWEKIREIYDDIRNNTYTLWDNGYPNEELIKWDIERKGLWGVFDNEKLIAISFVGKRNEDGEENYTWKDNFKKRGTFARIGVSPKYQNKGIGTLLVDFILKKLKSDGYDGVRILVGTQNTNAIKLYTKFGFINCGKTEKYNHEYYLFELRLS
jgi:ribosomal protein S18 acetylase RimI-like enzyme